MQPPKTHRLIGSCACLPFALACSAGGPASNAEVGSAPGGAASGSPSDGVISGLLPDNQTPTFAPDDVEPTDECDGVLPVVYRDFNEAHPDFEMEFRGDVVRRNLIAAELGPSGKPTFASSVGCPAQQGTPTACADWSVQEPVITSAASFDQWYRNVDGVNMAFEGTIVLTETTPGSDHYVFNSNEFFPIGNDEGLGVSPAGGNRNFLFTTEIHLDFQYVAGQTFKFRGDDDLWIFVNRQLALDLGSLHGAEEGTIDFDAQAATLGIVPGRAYPMDIFHAERHTDQSNFAFETNIACFTPSILR